MMHQSFKQYLNEKLLVINKGAKEGQVVFLAGGAGSGKDFALQHFMEKNKFKALNVDDWKELYLKITNRYPELQNINLKNPKDVFFLHQFVKDKGIKNAAFSQLFAAARAGVTTPNILFNVTLKDYADIKEVVPTLLENGYKKENIHIVWVLADYSVAVKRNRSRSRVVPDDILLKTHEGAASVVSNMVFNNQYPYSLINGGLWVILNNPENTILYNPDTAGETGNFVIKDFKYLKVKEPGKRVDKTAVNDQLYDWIVKNVPKTLKAVDAWKK